MHTLSYIFVACPLSFVIYGIFCCCVTYLFGGHGDWRSYIKMAMLIEFGLVLSQSFIWANKTLATNPQTRRTYPEQPSEDVMSKFGFPLLDETIKFCMAIGFVVVGKIMHVRSVSSVCVVAAVYGAHYLIGNIFRFCPINYRRRFARFLVQHEIYTDHITQKIVASPSTVVLDTTLVGPEDAESVFNLNSFQKYKPLSHSALLPVMNKTHPHQAIDRMYSVSPKNTLHCLIGLYGHMDEVCEHNLEGYHDTLATIPDVASIESSDTHLGGGGGGNFKYHFPDGSKLEFGGGAGFDYRRKHSHEQLAAMLPKLVPSDSMCGPSEHVTPSSPKRAHSDSSCSTRDCCGLCYECNVSDTSVPYELSHSRSFSPSAYIEGLRMWLRWLVPVEEPSMPPKRSDQEVKRSIRKKLSTYTLNSDTLSLKTLLHRLYGTVDLESQTERPKCENVHAFYEFTRFANKFFDMRTPHLVEFSYCVDPAFCMFGTLLPNFLVVFFLVQATSIIMWQFASTLLLAYPFVGHSHTSGSFLCLVPVVMVSRLFCINYLRVQATCSYRVSLVAEFVVYATLLLLAFCCYL